MELTLDEVSKALTCISINNDSSPGIDGIPVSWYKVFYNKIKLPLFNSLKCSVENECLGISTRRSVLTLLHKGKDLSKDETGALLASQILIIKYFQNVLLLGCKMF